MPNDRNANDPYWSEEAVAARAENQRIWDLNVTVAKPRAREDTDTSGLDRCEPPRESLAESYAWQRYRFRLGEGKGEALLDPVATGPCVGAFPFDRRVHFITGWSPHGQAQTFDEACGSQRRVYDAVAVLGAEGRLAAGHAGERHWIEELALTIGLTDAQAVEVGRDAGQPAVTGWDAEGLDVLPTGLVDLEPVRLSWTLQVRPDIACPLRLDDPVDEKCRVYGGPWTSGSRSAGAIWYTHRSICLALLGCDACADGSELPHGAIGTPMAIAPVVVASRYRGYTFRSRSPRSPDGGSTS